MFSVLICLYLRVGLRVKNLDNTVLTIPPDCKVFKAKFNQIQDNISKISVCDKPLVGKVLLASYRTLNTKALV